MKLARLGILLDKRLAEARWEQGESVFEVYAQEVFSHAGFSFTLLEDAQELEAQHLDVLVVALGGEDEASAAAIWTFAERGGTVMAVGGLGALAGSLGCREQRHDGPGYALLKKQDQPLRFLSASLWLPGERGAEEVGSLRAGSPDGPQLGPALLSFKVGRGVIERWAVDVFGTIVKLQQGSRPVLKDGSPAPDGSAAIDDGILKADDVFELDWALDRLTTETGAPFFAYPYADLWREALIGHLLERLLEQGLTLPFVDCWPEGVRAVALISHDSDGNVDASAETTLGLLRDLHIHTTWCMIAPGYSRAINARVVDEGHELAFHYNAMREDGHAWSEEAFKAQLQELKQAAGMDAIVSNKNHVTRVEGWGELFSWCEKCGVQSDQTRGPSKRGNVGFLFGTCHPYYPIAWADEKNRPYDVLELGFISPDIDHGKWSDSSVIKPLLGAVLSVRGVAHLIFHQVHLHGLDPVRRAMVRFVDEARTVGFAFWTGSEGSEINSWERARQTVTLYEAQEGVLGVTSTQPLASLVLWIPEARALSERERPFNIPCRKVILRDLAAGMPLHLQLDEPRESR